MRENRMFDECFTYRSPENRVWHFNTTALREWIESDKRRQFVRTWELSKSVADTIMTNNGTEERKIERLSQRLDIYTTPGIAIMWGTGQQTIIDGNHRIVVLYRKGFRTFDTYCVSLEIAEKFLVNMPTDEAFVNACLGRSDTTK